MYSTNGTSAKKKWQAGSGRELAENEVDWSPLPYGHSNPILE